MITIKSPYTSKIQGSNHETGIFSFKALIIALVLFGIGYIPQAFAIQEVEPNNDCASAQDLGSAALPLTIDGAITVNNSVEADIFKLTGTPGDTIVVDLNSNSQFLFFKAIDSTCNNILIGTERDINNPGVARFRLKLPNDGIVLL